MRDNAWNACCLFSQVRISASVKATRFRVPFTYWPARATSTHSEGDLLYTPCHVLAAPASLAIRLKFEDDSQQEIAIQYQYVVDAFPLGPSTLFLAVLLQGPEEVNLSHIKFGQVALLQVSPCPAKQLGAIIRDRAALSVRNFCFASCLITAAARTTCFFLCVCLCTCCRPTRKIK